MPYFHIRVVDNRFDTVDEGQDYPELDDAHLAAIVAAGDIALDEIKRGHLTWSVEARVETAGGQPVDRVAISMTTANL